MKVKIYLRSIVINGKKQLAMFDSNRAGDIDNLVTIAEPGDKIIWKPDCCSGIKSITKIFPKRGKNTIFKKNPQKQLLCRGFEMQVPLDAERGSEEAYNIEYILCDDTKGSIDPYIRIPPPRIPGQ